MGWTYLILAGVFEIGFTTFMKMSEGFTRGWPTGSVVVSAILSLWLLNLALQTIPLGTAYAVWTSIGAFGTAVVGMVFFHDPVSAGRMFFLFLLIASVIGLKLVSAS
jgi:quaternary ammonium compound-resistance protein SugE